MRSSRGRVQFQVLSVNPRRISCLDIQNLVVRQKTVILAICHEHPPPPRGICLLLSVTCWARWSLSPLGLLWLSLVASWLLCRCCLMSPHDWGFAHNPPPLASPVPFGPSIGFVLSYFLFFFLKLIICISVLVIWLIFYLRGNCKSIEVKNVEL
jgi:hypothetical protein